LHRRTFLQTPGILAAASAAAAPAPVPAPPSGGTAASPARWRGNWIWIYPQSRTAYKTINQAQSRNSYFYVRKSFELPAAPTRTLARVCADSRYTLYINGQRIGFGPARSDPRRQSFDVYTKEIAAALRPGRNVVAALVHHIGEGTFSYILGRAAFLCELDIEAGGTPLRLQTDSSWKLLPGLPWQPVPYRMSLQTDFPEIYDARLEPTGWNTAGYDDSWWSAPVLIGPPPVSPWGGMVPREIPFFAERTIAATTVAERGHAVPMEREYVVETEEVFGRPEIRKQRKLGSGAEVSFDVESATATDLYLVVGASGSFEAEIAGADGKSVTHRDRCPAGSSGHLMRRALPAVPIAAGRTHVSLRFGLDGAIQNLYTGHLGKPDLLRYTNWRARGGILAGWTPIAPAINPQTEIAVVQHTERLLPAAKPDAPLTRVEPSSQDTYVVLDFGREVFGFPQLTIRAAGEGTIDIGYCEHLENGRPVPNHTGLSYADRYLLRPGAQRWQTFEKRAFRYMQLDFRGLTAPVELESVGMLFSTYPAPPKGDFHSSDERLNRIWDVGRYTVQLNMDDAYTDCPWRERGMWMGDARVEGLVGFYAFGDHKLLARTLRLIGESQDGEGLTRGLYPSSIDFRLPSFTLLWVVTIWDYYLHTGNSAFLRELFPKVQRALAFFERQANANGLLEDLQKNYWVFIDWTAIDNQGEATAINCFWVGAIDAAARMADALGLGGDGARYRRLAARTRKGVQTRLWNAERRVFADCRTPAGLSKKISQPSNALAVLFGVAPAGTERAVMEAVLDPANEAIPVGSPYFSFYLLQAMYRTGLHTQALAYTREQWGKMLDRGATTWWEEWNGSSSWCHGWSAGPTYDLMSEFAGLKPAAPGFGKIAVRPNPCGLTKAAVRVATGRGDARVEWTVSASGFAADIEAPAGTPVDVALPRLNAAWSQLTVDGKPVEARLTASRAEWTVEGGGRHRLELRSK
jgi:alpha-L-rhamnosidase